MSAAKRPGRGRRPFLTIAALFLVGVVIIVLWTWWPHRADKPTPPLVDLTGVDPAVQRAVTAARAAVLEHPDSAEAWGKLGMVLIGHGLPVEASNACLAEAERLDPRQPRWPYLQATS